MLFFTNLTKKPIRRAAFQKLYRHIFKNGNFDLSVVFASPVLMKKLNMRYRGKNKPANVLLFQYDKRFGEVFLNVQERNLPSLFVHGCLHLLGYDHKTAKSAARMEQLERKFLNLEMQFPS